MHPVFYCIKIIKLCKNAQNYLKTGGNIKKCRQKQVERIIIEITVSVCPDD